MTYQLPHLLDRPGQLEAMDWILNNNKKYLILCAPTGFGKSPLAAQTSIDFRTLVLVLHKSLQSANYKEQYDFDILYGMSNYPCKDKNSIGLTANDCDIPDCACPYQKQRILCLSSQRVSLNYAKFLMTKRFTKIYQPRFLFLDEAHNLPNIIMNFVGLTLNWNNEFVQSNGNIQPLYEKRLNYFDAMALFRQYARVVKSNKPNQKEDLDKWRRWKRLSQKIEITDSILKYNLSDWYYETNHKQLIIKPLTAKYHFKQLFNVADKIVLMSATITPNIAERLGIEDDEFDYMEIPSVWPVPTRLVYDLKCPAMNWKSSEADKQEQAGKIANVLTTDKSGIIHTMSKSQSYELSKRLHYLGFNTYIPTENIGTDNQLQEWYDLRSPGIYCISWSFHEGVDLGNDDINIMAKTPWASMASNYEKARIEYDPQWYNESTAKTVEQLFGRFQRGLTEHYLPGVKLAFIADSSWHRLKTNLSSDFRMRVRNWNGR